MSTLQRIEKDHGVFAACSRRCGCPTAARRATPRRCRSRRQPLGGHLGCGAHQARPDHHRCLFLNDHSRSFENQTVRNIAHVSVGGRRVRVRVSNAFGVMPLRVGAAHVALAAAVRRSTSATGRRLTFGGQPSILVPAGAVVVSDAVDLYVASASDLAVSLYLPGVTEPATFNEFKMQTSYVTGVNSGNLVNAADLPTAEAVRQIFYTTVVEVQPTESVGALVAFGDSITLGGELDTGCLTAPGRTCCRRGSTRIPAATVGGEPGYRLQSAVVQPLRAQRRGAFRS